MEWYEEARAAEERRDWDTAIELVSARAECYAADHVRHDAHLWHMDLLVRADRLPELVERGGTDVHARRRLNRALAGRGEAESLRARAADGDRGALYALVRLLCETGREAEAQRAVEELGPDDRYAHEIAADHRSR
ncbi:hypothetical protein AB0M28_17585 [Streptomyces sp. NPDC051940]|uniref:hypothetical protein n=1 Tax=Streptomyces sp. NPDC051940 TaxID=3155675 RepID=UPI003449AB0E